MFGIDRRRHIGAIFIEVNPEKAFPTADDYIAEKAGTALAGIDEEVKNIS